MIGVVFGTFLGSFFTFMFGPVMGLVPGLVIGIIGGLFLGLFWGFGSTLGVLLAVAVWLYPGPMIYTWLMVTLSLVIKSWFLVRGEMRWKKIICTENAQHYPSLSDLRQSSLRLIEVEGFSVFKKKAEEVYLDLPKIARELLDLHSAYNKSTSQIKTEMYRGEILKTVERLLEMNEIFSQELVRLEREQPSREADESKIVVSKLATIGGLEDTLDELRRLRDGMVEAEDETPQGTALEREIDGLKQASPLPFPRVKGNY